MRQAKKSRNLKRWIFLFSCAAILFIFRKSLILSLVKIGLSYSLAGKDSSFDYDHMQWENDCVRIDSACFENPHAQMHIDQVRIAFTGNLFSWRLHCTVLQPAIHIKAASPSQAIPLRFLPLSSKKISFEVHDGIVHLDENPPLYFTFLPSSEVHRLGRIALSYGPESDRFPLFTAEIEEQEEGVCVDFSLVEEDCSRLLPIAQSLFPKLPKEWEERQGRVDASGKVRMDKEGFWTGLSCQWEIDDLALKSSSSDFTLLAERMSGSFASDNMLAQVPLWHKGKANMLFKGAEFHVSSLLPYHFFIENGEAVFEPGQEPHLNCAGICEYEGKSLAFSIHAQGEMHPDASIFLGIHGLCGGISQLAEDSPKDNLVFDGSIWCFDEVKYAVELNYDHLCFDHLDFFASHLHVPLKREYWIEGPSDGKVNLLYENGILQIDGEMAYGEEKIRMGALFDGSFSHLKEGWFETEGITERSYSSLLHALNKDLLVTGAVQIKGNFDPSGVFIAVQGSDLKMHHPQGDFFLPTLGEQGAQFTYQFPDEKWKGEIPLCNASWIGADPLWNADSIQGVVYIDGNHASIPTFTARNQNKNFHGQLPSVYFDGQAQTFSLEKGVIEWRLDSGDEIAAQIPYFNLACGQQNTSDFHLMLYRDQECFCALAGSAHRRGTDWEIALDRQRTHFLKTPLNITGCRVSSNRRIALEMHPIVSTGKLLSDLGWLSRVGFASFSIENLKDLPCHGTFEAHIATQDLQSEVRFDIHSKDIIYNGRKIAPFSFRGKSKKYEIDIDACQGEGFTCRARMHLQENSVRLHDVEGQFFGLFLTGSGDIDLRDRAFNLALDSVKGSLPSFKGADWLSGSFMAHGTVKGNLGTPAAPFCMSGDAICTFDFTKPLSMTAWNIKPLKISYTYNSGLCIEDLCANLKSKKGGTSLGLLSFGRCNISSQFDAWQASACECSINSHAVRECVDAHLLPTVFKDISIPHKLEIAGDMQMGREGFKCLAGLKDSTFCIKNTPLTLQKIGLQCQRGVLTLQAKTMVGEQPLWGALSVALAKNPQAIFRITDDPQAEGVRMHCRWLEDQLHWEKIQGSCLGVQVALSKNGGKQITGRSVLTGRVDIDASRLPALLPADSAEKIAQFKLGKGYSWQGDLILWQDVQRGFQFQVKGEITGDNWEFLGYRLRELHAGIDADLSRVVLSNVHVADAAGTIVIKKMEMEKNEHWELAVPIISIREWHPSSMHKIDAPTRPSKPFLIRNFTLSNIHGDLERFESLEGKGKLTFTNQCKKESTLLDTPIELIKNFGIDPGLLTPVQGEIDIDLRGSKMFLVGLKDVYSEAKRSEFYLAPGRELSYIDLDGTIRIDLKMRQDVTLKITEPFVLTIRGKLDNPRYGLDLLP